MPLAVPLPADLKKLGRPSAASIALKNAKQRAEQGPAAGFLDIYQPSLAFEEQAELEGDELPLTLETVTLAQLEDGPAATYHLLSPFE